MVRFHVSPREDAPIYLQIVRQVVDAVAGGRLQPGDRLPSHRELAASLVVAPLTVKKAYDELERRGYLEMRRGQGTFLREEPPVLSDDEKRERLRAMARRLAAEAYLIGMGPAELARLIREERRRMEAERRKESQR